MERKLEFEDQKDCISVNDQVQMEEMVDLMEAGGSKAAVQGEGEEGGDQVGEHLVAVGLTQEGEGEDGQVGEDAESVEYAETGNQTAEGGLEAEICFVDDTETYQVACNIIYFTDQQY